MEPKKNFIETFQYFCIDCTDVTKNQCETIYVYLMIILCAWRVMFVRTKYTIGYVSAVKCQNSQEILCFFYVLKHFFCLRNQNTCVYLCDVAETHLPSE